MNISKLFFIVAFLLFGVIAVKAVLKKDKVHHSETVVVDISKPIAVNFEDEVRSINHVEVQPEENITQFFNNKEEKDASIHARKDEDLPKGDRIEELFRKVNPKLPIVETITYKSKVDWLKGRPAWISDYAAYYKTSRHFIARSLNGKRDYFKQNVALGDRFNVFKLDKDLSFYLVIDTTRSKMWLYYYDKGAGEKVLLKVYDVGLGRVDNLQASGLLTPLGQYRLGEKVAIYKPGKTGLYQGNKVEMMRIFGTRWIPFEEEIGECTAPAKGLGIHGAPWTENAKNELVENTAGIGKYESDGCIRLKSDDMEEIFAIILTRPSYVILVKDFFDANVPGVDRGL